MLAEGGFNVRPLCGVTLREIVHISAGGAQIRVALYQRVSAPIRSPSAMRTWR